MTTEISVPTRIGEVRVHQSGTGPRDVLLLHGLTDDGRCWGRLAEALGAECTFHALDLPGHGGSARIGPKPIDQVVWMREVLSGIGLSRLAVVGHSIGGLLAMWFANRYPECVHSLVLEDPPPTRRFQHEIRDKEAAAFAAVVAQFRAQSIEACIAQGRNQYPHWHLDEIRPWAFAKHHVDPNVLGAHRIPPWRDLLDQLRSRTMIVTGDPQLGALCTAEHVSQVGKMQDAPLWKQIAGAGHNVRRENLDGFLAAVRIFWESGSA